MFGLRKINDEDFEFLWQLHNAALKEYVTQTWGWDEDWQRKDFTERFNTADGKIIVINGTDAGFLWVINKESETKLASIRLLPEFQNKRIGTQIIQNLIEVARAVNKPLTLHVLKVNPAKNLYERLGFETVEELEHHFLMKFN